MSQSIKLVVVGDSAVGKTSLARKFSGDEFDVNEYMTIGVDYYCAYLADQDVRVCVWDTAGAERFHAITRSYYRATDAAWFVFCDDVESVRNWLREFRNIAGEHIPVLLVRSKCDEERSATPPPHVREFMEEERIEHYLETSALKESSEQLQARAARFLAGVSGCRRLVSVNLSSEDGDYGDARKASGCPCL